MRKLCVAIALGFVLCSTARAEPAEEALRVLDKWTKAFSDSDVDGIVKLYAPDALFLGTRSKVVVANREGIRKYFTEALLSNRPRSAKVVERSIVVLSDTAVVVTGLDVVTEVRDGMPQSARGRFSFVVAQRGAEWQIVHFHRSPVPS